MPKERMVCSSQDRGPPAVGSRAARMRLGVSFRDGNWSRKRARRVIAPLVESCWEKIEPTSVRKGSPREERVHGPTWRIRSAMTGSVFLRYRRAGRQSGAPSRTSNHIGADGRWQGGGGGASGAASQAALPLYSARPRTPEGAALSTEMRDTAHELETNLKRVRERIAGACREAGRRPESVTLVAVTK